MSARARVAPRRWATFSDVANGGCPDNKPCFPRRTPRVEPAATAHHQLSKTVGLCGSGPLGLDRAPSNRSVSPHTPADDHTEVGRRRIRYRTQGPRRLCGTPLPEKGSIWPLSCTLPPGAGCHLTVSGSKPPSAHADGSSGSGSAPSQPAYGPNSPEHASLRVTACARATSVPGSHADRNALGERRSPRTMRWAS